MTDVNGQRLIRNLGSRVREAVQEHGALPVVNALEGALDDLNRLDGGGRGDPVENARPSSLSYDSLEEYRAAVRQWHEWRAERSGPATERGRVPPIITKKTDD